MNKSLLFVALLIPSMSVPLLAQDFDPTVTYQIRENSKTLTIRPMCVATQALVLGVANYMKYIDVEKARLKNALNTPPKEAVTRLSTYEDDRKKLGMEVNLEILTGTSNALIVVYNSLMRKFDQHDCSASEREEGAHTYLVAGKEINEFLSNVLMIGVRFLGNQLTGSVKEVVLSRPDNRPDLIQLKPDGSNEVEHFRACVDYNLPATFGGEMGYRKSTAQRSIDLAACTDKSIRFAGDIFDATFQVGMDILLREVSDGRPSGGYQGY